MSERDLQKQVVQLLESSAAKGVIWWHTPNGEYRSKRTAGLLKGMGVKAGVPDLVIIPPGGKAHFIELKYGRGRLSPAQAEFQAAAIVCPCPHAVVRTLEEAATVLHTWGAIRENPFAKPEKARAAA